MAIKWEKRETFKWEKQREIKSLQKQNNKVTNIYFERKCFDEKGKIIQLEFNLWIFS